MCSIQLYKSQEEDLEEEHESSDYNGDYQDKWSSDDN